MANRGVALRPARATSAICVVLVPKSNVSGTRIFSELHNPFATHGCGGARSEIGTRTAIRGLIFFDIIGFNIWRCWCDAMHCLDLGVYQSVAASCLTELVEEGVWTHVGEDGFKVAHVAYKEWCVERGLPPAPRFEKARLFKKRTDFPKFTQQSAKASATRYIMKWLYQVLQRMDHAGSTVHSKRRLETMAAFDDFQAPASDMAAFFRERPWRDWLRAWSRHLCS